MKYVLLSVRDRAADAFDRPFSAVSVNVAIRSFSDEINNATGNHPFALHPEDFDLFHLGFFHDDHARFELLDHPLQIAIGKDLRRPAVPSPAAQSR